MPLAADLSADGGKNEKKPFAATIAEREKAAHSQMVQSALLALTALIAIAAVGIAWFLNNNRVSATNGNVQSAGPKFELATVGAAVGVYDSTDTTQNIVGDAKTIGSTTYYETSGLKTLITWMTSDTSNFHNEQGTGKDTAIYPGASGSITFSILPQTSALGKVDFTLQLTPYAVVEQASTADGKVQVASGVYAAPLSESGDTQYIYTLLKGHILLFQNYNSSTGVYSDWIDPSKGFTSTEISGTDPVPITLYWIWPEVFANYISADGGLSGNSDLLASMAITAATGQKYTNYFFDANDLPTLSVSTTMTADDQTKAKTYYDNADQEIGTYARYVQLLLTADQASTD
jgi:hypothetical protein